MSNPNILLLLTDQQQGATIDPSTPCSTPNIDRLGEQGTRFSRCYAPNPICSPSRASLMTGLLPHSHGMINLTNTVEPFGTKFRDDLETWSERLDAEGYHMGYFGKWHVERSHELHKFGFDEYELSRSDGFQEAFAEHRRSLDLNPESPRHSPERLSNTYSLEHKGYRDHLLYGVRDEPPEGTEAAFLYSRGIDFIREAADRSDPWCLTVSSSPPHDPYVPPRESYERYNPEELTKPSNFHDPMHDKPNIYRRKQAVFDDMSWEEFAEATACYYAVCSHIDDQVGRILNALSETNQLEDTVVIYTSDHGDYMGAHRLLLKSLPPFEEVYNVPLVIRWPGVGENDHICDDIVQLHDLGATIVDIADGGEFPPEARIPPRNTEPIGSIEEFEGTPSYKTKSLVPFLQGERPPGYEPEAFAETHGDDFPHGQRIYWRENYKYVFNMFDNDELYDLEEDPGETMNLVDNPDYQQIKENLAVRMWEIAQDTADYQLSELHYGTKRIGPVGPDWRPE